MANNVYEQILKAGYLFELLSPDELVAVGEIVKEKQVIAGDYVFDEGAAAEALFMIKNGTIEILKKSSDGDDHSVCQLTKGSHFGEMSFVDRAPRAASAMARENVTLLEIHFKDLDQLIANKPAIGLRIFRSMAAVMCRRIRQTTNELSSLRELKLRHV